MMEKLPSAIETRWEVRITVPRLRSLVGRVCDLDLESHREQNRASIKLAVYKESEASAMSLDGRKCRAWEGCDVVQGAGESVRDRFANECWNGRRNDIEDVLY